MPKSGVEHLANHPGWKTKKQPKPQPIIVVTVEGGLVTSVGKFQDGQLKPAVHAVIDWDYAKDSPIEFWENLVPDLQDYVKKNLKEEWKWLEGRMEAQKKSFQNEEASK